MYDRLAPLLGLGALSEAAERLASREQQLAHSEKKAKTALPPLLTALADAQDERIQEAARALQQRTPDRDRIRSLITGAPLADTTDLARLHRLGRADRTGHLRGCSCRCPAAGGHGQG
ncbi:hypothetical protein [Streptomyces sp. NPDC056683]|uniref:hypothetical protein n=1 Tax=Streptomyces sp. NPDC056683 TaxID=3345910 RepID=UPI0036B49C6D